MEIPNIMFKKNQMIKSCSTDVLSTVLLLKVYIIYPALKVKKLWKELGRDPKREKLQIRLDAWGLKKLFGCLYRRFGKNSRDSKLNIC